MEAIIIALAALIATGTAAPVPCMPGTMVENGVGAPIRCTGIGPFGIGTPEYYPPKGASIKERAPIATDAGDHTVWTPGDPIGPPGPFGVGEIQVPPPSIEKRLHLQGAGEWYTPSDPWQNAASSPVYYDVPGWQAQTAAGDRPDERSGGLPTYLGGILEP
ncbi:hypothetical protein LTR10_017003 [Elasticomyces elasticus]|uniref:Uncharacterized protein n=1 Tax=Exophiala sideris TaxID=1016849 RepID=A0ABR0JGS6_9EURO|nr:hypothetical protein LTR10_017003 [Elasticomyces elasticus]KAK5025257.1 hypothetical protein LTS07_008108 [Exophiala sideris]KAK5029195.1 hypothetical protein LTR13_008732 [Exophiala sideris]KAK5063316.1 hypothetical protein LTR69_004022 [Exophiala sideris]KAK5179032.1 hypothetical protein LTR44_008521 [Eurotiomycetes sp. CCFEE 6388]